MSMADELLKLQRLRDSGTLTADEFEQVKDKLLAADPPVAPSAPSYSVLKEVDPDVTRVANKAVNLQGATALVFMVVFLIVASVVAFGACTVFQRIGDSDPFGGSQIEQSTTR